MPVNIALKTLKFVVSTLLLILSTTISVNSKTSAKIDAKSLRLDQGRYLFYDLKLASKDHPTLVFLPGINRSVPIGYESLQVLYHQQKFNILTAATSSHWESLQFLKPNEIPFYARNNSLSVKDFMLEVEELIHQLQIPNPILVGLSYSGAMQVHSSLPQIFVAPIVKASDSNPTAAEQAKAWEAGLALNPIFGSIWIRQFRDNGYRQYWSQRVTSVLRQDSNAYAGVPTEQVINSYVSLSRAAEDFDLTKANLNTGKRNLFVLGAYEDQLRLKGQINTVLNSLKQNKTVTVLFIEEAEHNVMVSQPKGFVKAISTLFVTKPKTQLEVGVVGAGQKPVRWLKAEEVTELFKTILAFPDSTDSAKLKL